MDNIGKTENASEFSHSDCDIYLMVPPTYPEGREPDYNPKSPLGLEYLSGNLLENGMKSKIKDFDVEGKSSVEVIEDVLAENPRVLGMTVLQRALPAVRRIHLGLREQGYDGLIVYGGIGATLCSEEIITEFCDSNCVVIEGEGEIPLVRLLQEYKRNPNDFLWKTPNLVFLDPASNRIERSRRLQPGDPRSLPWPDRQNLQKYIDKTGYLTILGSRGCPWSKCSFCSNAAFEKQHDAPVWRSRTPEDIVDEIVSLYSETGIHKFKTNDPNLFGIGEEGERHVIDLCNYLQNAKSKGVLPESLSIMSFIRGEDVAGKTHLLEEMKMSGFDRLLVGVESSDNVILKKYFTKGENIQTLSQAITEIKNAGISPIIGFLIFNPYTTLDTLKKDLDFLTYHNLPVNLTKSLRIFNNVPLQFVLESEDRLVKNSPFETYHEYLMSREISAIYFAMKNLHVLIEDPISKVAQDRIWEIKSQGNKFNERFDYEDLTNTIWRMELSLLESCINYYDSDGNPVIGGKEELRLSIDEIYNLLEYKLFHSLGLDGSRIVANRDIFFDNIRETLDKKATTNFHEEYVWEVI